MGIEMDERDLLALRVVAARQRFQDRSGYGVVATKGHGTAAGRIDALIELFNVPDGNFVIVCLR